LIDAFLWLGCDDLLAQQLRPSQILPRLSDLTEAAQEQVKALLELYLQSMNCLD
jgi:hypothetical protein